MAALEAAANSRKPVSSSVRPSSWADGLRGIAAIFVVSSHVCLCFWTFLIPPSRRESSTYLFQRPFFRLVIQGNAWVAVFFVLLGFVNSLKTVQLARAGAVNDAFNSLASSIYRRAGRMVLPAAAVTVLSWVLCQLGAYRLAYQTNSFWLTETSPKPSASWFSALGDLTHELIRTWTEGANEYDQPQWTLLHLFKGSLYVILTLLATAKATPTFRVIMEVVLYLWCWKSLDPFGICIFAGMILAELSMSATAAPKRTSAVRQVISIGFAILGLYLCSFPSEYYTEAPWCNQLYQIGLRIFPVGAPQGRYWPGVGAQMLCASILYSPILRTALSHRILRYLGGISLPLYLLHGPLIYSILTYMVYLPGYLFSQPVPVSDPSQEGTTVLLTPGPFHLAIAITLFSIVLLFTGRLWSIYVEPYFGDLTDRIERLAQSYGKTDGMSSNASGPILPVHEKS